MRTAGASIVGAYRSPEARTSGEKDPFKKLDRQLQDIFAAIERGEINLDEVEPLKPEDVGPRDPIAELPTQGPDPMQGMF